MMSVSDYRNETTAKLVKLDERQISIFKTLQRIEKHLEKLNGQTSRNSDAIIMFKTWGSAALLIVPIVVTLIMRLIP
jgi:hypothetical protein|tara:strand:+ start:281 stop:511 length:231 start_codon:yes stop_codon:yes gene_type:complete